VLYYPWVRAAAGGTRLVPPSGHVAGVYARSDLERGVHKAPASEIVRGLVEADATHPPLAVTLGQREQEI
jgi:Bacteriophage tail sheath protein